MTDAELIDFAKHTVDIEISALTGLKEHIDGNFVAALKLIYNCSGKVIITGMGKSGHIANKIAATFASTGTPSFFLHPGEAGHGDLGMVSENDVLIALSYSGTASEIMLILPIIKRMGVKTIAITGNSQAIMSTECDVWLNGSVAQEACPNNLAPTSSTTTALAIGDALAMTLLEMRGFSADDFARSHPSGALGKKLLTNVEDIMHTDLPLVSPEDNVLESLVVMSSKQLGILIMVDEHTKLLGVFTDGDLRRLIQEYKGLDILTMAEVIGKLPKMIEAHYPAVKALELMEAHNINALPVVSKDKVVGAINMQTLMQHKII